MISEKFSLKWNDFQATVSQSIGLLRAEEDFFDVTLVSDDQQMIPAHKLVLSASSPYFKQILTTNKHSHPLLCLHGVDSGNLKTVLDYIYQGEVEVGHENLERFLSIAEMFQLDGLTAKNKVKNSSGGLCEKNEEEDENKENKENEEDDETVGYATPTFPRSEEDIQHLSSAELEEDAEEMQSSEEDITDMKMETVEEEVEDLQNNRTVSSPRSLKVESSNIADIELKILENIELKPDGSHSCKVCGKNSTGKSARTILRQHIETHLEGVSYSCPHCTRTFRYT